LSRIFHNQSQTEQWPAQVLSRRCSAISGSTDLSNSEEGSLTRKSSGDPAISRKSSVATASR
jgi:hypothetical protein